MNALIEFWFAHSGGIMIGMLFWAATVGMALNFADRRGYDQGFNDGYDEGAREGVEQCRAKDRGVR